MNNTPTPLVAASFLNNRDFPYGIPESMLADNGTQFIAQIFLYLCVFLVIRGIPIASYHPHSKGQTERYNKSISARLQRYISHHKTDWDLSTQPLTYYYDKQVHKTTDTSQFWISLTKQFPSTIVQSIFTVSATDTVGRLKTRELRMRVLGHLRHTFAAAGDRSLLAPPT